MNRSKILRVFLAVLWRVVLVAAVLLLLLAAGTAMVLNMVFKGPSETARNTLTITLLEHEATEKIPGYFLDAGTIDAICAVTDSLPAEISDKSLITMADSGSDQEFTLSIGNSTATVSITYGAADEALFDGAGDFYAGFTDDGILMVAASSDAGISGRCEKILMMNGLINTGLYNSNSGYAARSAIGQAADGSVIYVTMASGTYQNLMDILAEYGAVNACVLPGNED